jgi:ATP adenylyltransferase
MIAVARQQDHYQSIPVNSLGFAGSLLVKNLEQFELLKPLAHDDTEAGSPWGIGG